MTESQCSFVPSGRLRCPRTGVFVVSVTVDDGHLTRVCAQHLALTCRRLAAESPMVIVAVPNG